MSCCINNCLNRSGKPVDEENRVTFFSFPVKNLKKHQSWIDAVGPHLKIGHPNRKNLYVCQHHFDDSSFLKGGIKIWKDGVEVIQPRKKLQLTKDAVPSIFIAHSELQTPSAFKIIERNAQKHTVESTSAVPPAVAALDNQSKLTKNIARAVPDVYSKEHLIRDWNCEPANPLLLGRWGMVDLSDSGVLFTYSVDSIFEVVVSRSLIVKNDMSTKLQIRGRHSTFPILEKITCFEDVTSTLIKIALLRLCEDVSCKDGFFQPKPHSSNLRCHPCQKRKRQMDQREGMRRKRLLARQKKNAKENKNFKQKHRRSMKKIFLLKKKIEQLMAKRAAANENNLEEFIKSKNMQSPRKRTPIVPQNTATIPKRGRLRSVK